ncbi:HK97 gp10 family phage protein [Clostridium butyricum]|uniref:Phage protein, HK97 gp10 family n=1 Tax=Clostridium butyricum E4 str. BoNT E BL5262 TaxID=632245 RepID=C4IGR8_CLOBU|nr:HK97 gp10 family phage protein [Clostridium butyricum]EDT74771.1 hypothetical protein CBY_2549 [Clostridium butyricum 5521]EEP53144.1 conserved hypothetical protein [Clostridium butyricum E4 str. BoNT E BL5262]NFL30486.1 HK97 gp10 family phage protein [Clostridium butyricum]NFS19441.1 HK97 gp10 family phage protein [Clostridium butyricum]
MSDSIDFSELIVFEKNLLDLASTKMPKETKKFMKKQGNQLKTKVKKNANKTKKKSGKYRKSIKSGKVYDYKGALAVRAYSTDPKAHLIEHGFRHFSHGKETGFIEGQHIFEKSSKEFETKFNDNCGKFIDEMLDKGL